jgi:hypothetical protein
MDPAARIKEMEKFHSSVERKVVKVVFKLNDLRESNDDLWTAEYIT